MACTALPDFNLLMYQRIALNYKCCFLCREIMMHVSSCPAIYHAYRTLHPVVIQAPSGTAASSDIEHCDAISAADSGMLQSTRKERLCAGYTMSARKRSRSSSPAPSHSTQQSQQPNDSTTHDESDRVQQQLNALGACHVGYSHQVLPGKDISLVGVRPFSKV